MWFLQFGHSFDAAATNSSILSVVFLIIAAIIFPVIINDLQENLWDQSTLGSICWEEHIIIQLMFVLEIHLTQQDALSGRVLDAQE